MIRPRSPGQPLSIRASEWREIASTRDYVSALRRSSRASAPVVSRSVSTARVRNSTGADLALGHVVAIESPIFTSADNLEGFKRDVALVATSPAASSRGRVAITSEPIKAGKIGRAVLSGIAVARLDVIDRNAWSAAPLVGVTDRLGLVARGSIEVLHRDAGDTGVVWSIVRIGPSVLEAIWVVIDATLVVGSAPPRWKYELKRGTRDAATGVVTADTNGEEVWAYNDYEDPAAWGHGQSLTPGSGASLEPGPVEGPVEATWTGLYDPGDGRPIYRFDLANPMLSDCVATGDTSGTNQAMVEDIAEGT